MPDQVRDTQGRAVDRALLVAAFISFGFGMVAMVSGLLK
jgi:hypothetical protein